MARQTKVPGATEQVAPTTAAATAEVQTNDEAEQVAPTAEAELQAQLAAAHAEITALKKQKPEKTNVAIEESKGRIVLTDNGWTKEY